MWTLFEYLYRDAGNFKAFGCVALEGSLTLAEQGALRSHLGSDGLFIAEQLNVPPLYEELNRWSGGPTPSDHCWHELAELKVAEATDVPADAHRWGTAKQFLDGLLAIETWNEELSPHFRLAEWA